LCEHFNVDVENVRIGIGSDERIGYQFIYPGAGYGGSCFPKDVQALQRMAQQAGLDPVVLDAVETRNKRQKQRLFEKVTAHFGKDLTGKTFALWGLAFKPGTDDMREAPSLVLIESLIEAGAKIQAFDPVATETAKAELDASWIDQGLITFAEHQYDALDNADALVLITEWKPFRNPDFDLIKEKLKQPLIIDGRNQYDPDLLKTLDIKYTGIGRGQQET
ncbi:MAG: UDP binding domain-containing protein, partial [Candidatus Sedimenticola sp. 1PA]